MQNRNELYEVNSKKSELRITLRNKLSCKLWGEHWGIISNYFDTRNFLDECNFVKIDFSECYWADPIALLSILLQLMQVKYDYKKRIRIVLPRLGANSNSNFYRGKFLKFLATQGFMKIMIDNFEVNDNKEKLTHQKILKYANYNYQLLYDGAEIVQAKIYDIKMCNKDEIMRQLEEEVLFRLKSTVSLQTYYMLEAHAYNIITELIENVAQHAYNEDESKRFGVYIRKRYGAVKNYDKDEKEIEQYLRMTNKEEKNCPALDKQVLMDSEAILEIFFVDVGIGLKGSLQEYYKREIRKKYKYPIRELFYRVLKEGLRKHNLKSLTPYGGLHFICRILKESNGYIWCNEGKEWVGCFSGDLLFNVNNLTLTTTTYSI